MLVLPSRIMRTLAIDTSTPRAGLALLDGPLAIAARTFEPAQSAHAEHIVGAIDQLMTEAGWARSSLDLIACGTGPGSFTGVRVALATAKGIALALDRPIVGVSSLETMASAFVPHGVGGRAVVLPLIDAKKGELFGQPFGLGLVLEPLGAAEHFPRGALAERVAATAVAVSSPDSEDATVWVVGAVAAELDRGAARFHAGDDTDFPDPIALGRLGWRRFAATGGDPLDLLEPIYVRPPDAVPNLPA
jgi:tRNA threonylcarbamoyladenosine biosynthesis protein TsaB